ncbi:hypothetical protein EDD85DRAFT_957869 [Armillaria nabsnona]|nr:hypothetical protein EDD85DRAFT_957869 [Armillaria nabsnona]
MLAHGWLLPALSTLSEALTSSLLPTPYRAATPRHPGSWAPAPLPHERTWFLLPSSPLSHISSARPDILSHDAAPVLLLPFRLPPDVKKSMLDHQEVPSMPPGLACIVQNTLPALHYILVLLLPHSTFIAVDIPQDHSSSILNRMSSSPPIQVLCGSNMKPENCSHGSSKFASDLKAAILTLSLPQQLNESDALYSHPCEAYSLPSAPYFPVEGAAHAPPKVSMKELHHCNSDEKYKDGSLHSSHFNRGRASATSLEVVLTCNNPLEQQQSAFVKQDLCLSCKSLELPPQCLMKAESFLIHVAMKFDFPALRWQQPLPCLRRHTLIIDGLVGTTEIRSESF